MKVALLSPKGPLYRSSGGIFRKSLRYQPLTLTTLAALAPPELDIEFQLLRRRHRRRAARSRRRSRRHDGDHRQLAARLRARGALPRARHQGGARRPACHADARRGGAACRCHLHRLRRGDLAAAAARFRARRACGRRYDAGPRLQARRPAVPAPGAARQAATTSRRRCSKPRAPARTTASSAWRRPPGAASSCRSRWKTWSPTSASSASAASSSSISISSPTATTRASCSRRWCRSRSTGSASPPA